MRPISNKLFQSQLTIIIIFLLCSFVLFDLPNLSFGKQIDLQKTDSIFMPNEIILKFKKIDNLIEKLDIYEKKNQSPQIKTTTVGITSLDNINKKYKVLKLKRICKSLKFNNTRKRNKLDKTIKNYFNVLLIYKIIVEEGVDIFKAIENFKSDPHVEYAEPNYIYKLDDTIPNEYNDRADLAFTQWALDKIEAPEAWDFETGSDSVILAIIDTGVDWDHPDLSNNIWENHLEIPNNEQDDDGNGYIDDVRGWDFVNVGDYAVYPGEDPGPPDNNPMDFHGHGTHVSGIAGAVTNNSLGIAGVSWNCKIMPLRSGFKTSEGEGFLPLDNIIEALYYASNNGAHVINMSFGSYKSSVALEEAINYSYASNCVLIASAGNDNISWKRYPAALKHVLAVGATDIYDHKTAFSNYGPWIDLSAPGTNIYSTIFDNHYSSQEGTSMSSALVSGTAALLKSYHPIWNNKEILSHIINKVDKIEPNNPSYQNLLGRGRLNLFKVIADSIFQWAKIKDYSYDDGNSDSNGWLDPGEQADLYIRIENTSSIKLENIFSAIHTNDPLISISELNSQYDNLSTDGSGYNSNPFKVSIDPSTPSNYTFILHLELFCDQFPQIVRDSITINLRTPFILKNWPKLIGSSRHIVTPPKIEDIDRDGTKEIICATFDNWEPNLHDFSIHILKFDGSEISGWPVNIGQLIERNVTPPAIGDVDLDGKLEIVITGIDAIPGYMRPFGRLIVLNSDGTLKLNKILADFITGYSALSPPSIFDIDGDGDLEIFILSDSAYAFHHDGLPLNGWPIDYGWSFCGTGSTPSFGDIDGDGNYDIVFGTHACGDSVFAFNYDGTSLNGWPIYLPQKYLGEAICSPLAIGDIDGDNKVDVVGFKSISNEVYVWKGDGSTMNGWPYIFDKPYGLNSYGPILSDLDNDGTLEIILVLDGSCSPSENLVIVFEHDGLVRSGWPILFNVNIDINNETVAAIGNIDNDSEQEIIVLIGTGEIFAFNHDGTVVDGFPFIIGGWSTSGMAIGDLDADGDIELIATNAEHVYVLSGLGSYNQSMIGWEGFKHDAWNTGLYGFEIPELPQIHSLTYNFSSQGWYLISLPVTAENDSLNKLFPTAVESFSWDVNNQNYVSSNVLKPEIGYWLAIPSSVTSIVKGIALETYTMQCKMGWNLLGSVLDTVEVSSITSDPIGSILAVFCWDANKNKYLPVDKILPKNGYWFAISQDCEIFINSSTSNLAMKKYNLSGLTESFVNLFNNNPPPPPHTFSNVLANQILPTLFVLNQNYPNPFNPETIIKYQLPKLSNVELVIYNIMGQKVITLVNEKQAAGFYQVRWNGINSLGNQVSTGIYLYKLQAENFQDMKKMVFIR